MAIFPGDSATQTSIADSNRAMPMRLTEVEAKTIRQNGRRGWPKTDTGGSAPNEIIELQIMG